MKIEMHAHTSETSPCAHVKAKEVVSEYLRAEYDAVVITDHFNNYVLEADPKENEKSRVTRYLMGYHNALSAAKGSHLRIILGTEISLYKYGPEDYLLYGVTEEFLYANPYMYELSLKGLREICDKNGILLFQAHPGRNGHRMADIALLDGAEVFNGNPRHVNNNSRVYKWAEENGLLFSSGSDYHQKEDLGTGGIITSCDVKDAKDLAEVLRRGSYELVGRPEAK